LQVRRVLDALAAEEGSSSEDTSDEAYVAMHKPLEEDEHIRLNGPTGNTDTAAAAAAAAAASLVCLLYPVLCSCM
jgi:hypothetical protein